MTFRYTFFCVVALIPAHNSGDPPRILNIKCAPVIGFNLELDNFLEEDVI